MKRTATGQAEQTAIEIKVFQPNEKCVLCHRTKLEGNELEQAGKFFKFERSFYHYFCVLFSRGMKQRGDDEEGLFGFLYEDVLAGLKKARIHKCIYCNLNGAGCRCKTCLKSFHFVCGLENGSSFVFERSMETFCSDHVPLQSKSIKLKVEDRTCLAGCQEIVSQNERSLICPSCGHIFHLSCLQEMALHYGYAHYKCPLCSDNKAFITCAKRLGIYIPIKDASWEDVENENFYNFQQMGRRYSQCDANVCQCPHGRDHHKLGTLFEVIRCEYCGSSGTHILCGNLMKQAPFYVCAAHSNHEKEMADHRKEAMERLREANIFISDNEDESTNDESFKERKLSSSSSCSSTSVEEIIFESASEDEKAPKFRYPESFHSKVAFSQATHFEAPSHSSIQHLNESLSDLPTSSTSLYLAQRRSAESRIATADEVINVDDSEDEEPPPLKRTCLSNAIQVNTLENFLSTDEATTSHLTQSFESSPEEDLTLPVIGATFSLRDFNFDPSHDDVIIID